MSFYDEAREIIKEKDYWHNNEQIELWAAKGGPFARRAVLAREGGYIRIMMQAGTDLIEPGFAIGMAVTEGQGQRFEVMAMVSEESYQAWIPKARAALNEASRRRLAKVETTGPALWVTEPTN